jgi:hypothetical protein
MTRLPASLRLPPRYRHVQDYLVSFDGDLRIRRSVERSELFVLERRVRRAPTANLGMGDLSDLHVQARDGFIHISTVHPQYLERPWAIVEALKESGADLWDNGGASQFADELEYEETWMKESRRRRRRQLFRDIALEGYDLLNRIGSKRTRISVPGLRA